MVLLERHCHKCTLTNEKLNCLHNEQRTMLYKLKQDMPDSEELKSAEILNKRGHELFLDLISESHNYLYKLSNDGNHLVYPVGHESSLRIFKSLDDRCSCVDCMANMKQCVHKFVLTQQNCNLIGVIYILIENVWQDLKSLVITRILNFVYNNDNTQQCVMNSEDVDILEDFQMKETESTDVSKNKLSHISPLLSNDNCPSTCQNLSSDDSVSSSQQQSLFWSTIKKKYDRGNRITMIQAFGLIWVININVN